MSGKLKMNSYDALSGRGRDFFVSGGDLLTEEQKDASGFFDISHGVRISPKRTEEAAPAASASASNGISELNAKFRAKGGASAGVGSSDPAYDPNTGAAIYGKRSGASPSADPYVTRSSAPPVHARRGGAHREISRDTLLRVSIARKTVRHGRLTLLKDVHFSLQQGDFTLILGGSGAGKTTLIRSILGESKAEGRILLNDKDLYPNFKTMKDQIGLVPQFLTLRLNDTVENTITDAARIRLGGMYSKKEIAMRVESVIRKVGVQDLKKSLICNLSGGQKKKVAVATQLVGFQKVIICDEPDSGLDAASRIQLMDLLKDISNSGRIVMIITHYPDDAIKMFTKVIVIAKSERDHSGHMAYSGDVRGALDFFGVETLRDIMLQINPEKEGGKGLADHYIDAFNSRRSSMARV